MVPISLKQTWQETALVKITTTAVLFKYTCNVFLSTALILPSASVPEPFGWNITLYFTIHNQSPYENFAHLKQLWTKDNKNCEARRHLKTLQNKPSVAFLINYTIILFPLCNFTFYLKHSMISGVQLGGSKPNALQRILLSIHVDSIYSVYKTSMSIIM